MLNLCAFANEAWLIKVRVTLSDNALSSEEIVGQMKRIGQEMKVGGRINGCT